MTDCKPAITPVDTSSNNQTEIDDTSFNSTVYRAAVGSLLYLANATHLDISHAVNMATRNNQNPTNYDWAKVKRILRYLAGTTIFGIVYAKYHKHTNNLVGYSDSDFGSSDD